MNERTPPDVREHANELDERAMRGEGSVDDAVESMRLYWPAYFADPPSAPPMPPIRLSVAGYGETFQSLVDELPALERSLSAIGVPTGFVVGAGSPMPGTASTETAARIPGAWVETVPGAGHFVWVEAPGSVRAALDRLTQR
jgi:pimeloyl-ACP methyl ester carboxylesterase